MKRKAQSALEFVMLTSVALVGISVLIIAAQSMLLDVQHDQDEQVMGALLDAIVSELALADSQPAGYERTYTMPYSIDGVPYTIDVLEENNAAQASDGLRINYKDHQFLFFVAQNITGTINPGVNTLTRAQGVIILN